MIKVTAFLVVLFVSASMPKLFAEELKPRPWGNTFVPKSNEPARHIFAVPLDNLLPDERIALTCLQALTARKQPCIWLVRTRNDEACIDLHKNKGYIDSFETVTNWHGLFHRFRDSYKGAIIADENLYRGRLLALNAAACEDLIVVTPRLAEKLNIPVKIDLRERFTTYTDGLKWLWMTYKDKFSPYLCDFRDPALIPHGTFDYSFQWRGLMFWVAGRTDGSKPGADREAEEQIMGQILAEMKPNGVCVGFPAGIGDDGIGMGEPPGVRLLSRYGKALVCNNHMSNCSILSGFKIDSLKLPAPPAPPLLEQDKIYIALVLSDGDNQILWPVFFKQYFEHQEFGTFPLAFGMGPSIRELQPVTAQWYFEHAAPTTEFIADVSGAGYMHPDHFGENCIDREQVWDEFLTYTRYLMMAIGQRSVRGVDGGDASLERYAAALPFCHSIFADMGRYTGHSGITNLTYSLQRGMPVFRAVTSWRYGKEGFLREIREQVGEVRPAFVNGFVHCWTFKMEELVNIYKQRDKDMIFVTPSQLAALYFQNLETVRKNNFR